MLLRMGDGTGEAFIKTDQLDGETDWKLRTALGVTQDANSDDALLTEDFCLTNPPSPKYVQSTRQVWALRT
jgi:phospholipid-translocating ATPase